MERSSSMSLVISAPQCAAAPRAVAGEPGGVISSATTLAVTQ
jgi:hypothetical protein